MKTQDFNYFLPEELIAQHPASVRDGSRLLVLKPDGLEHRHFRDLKEYLRVGDLLVLNQTKVIPARILGCKETGAKVEVLLLRELEPKVWEALARPGKRLKAGSKINFGQGRLEGEILADLPDGLKKIKFNYAGNFLELLDQIGQAPLPPYIKTYDEPERYQTVYAQEPGSVAAPTAGLHFTPELLQEIREMGVQIAPVLLHVGLGTFRPVNVDKLEDHQMHQEFYAISEAAADLINQTKQKKTGRIIAVGTTSVRTLESAANAEGLVRAGQGWTDIFIYPGYQFKIVDSLITNFHLPCSTLLMLVSALAGRERVLQAYQVAVEQKYRFYSFGDAMFITGS